MIATLVVLAYVLFPATLAEAVWGAALMLSALFYAMCLALASVRGIKLLVVGFGLIWVAQMAVLGGPVVAEPHIARLVTGLLMHVLGGLILWGLAVRRWRGIDWLRFRPMRFNR
jgi:hypothetical protein